ncbi:MAG TPA: sugar transferase [Candidatus Paceibacterota bacterium]|nr:sugar transferase [Candidatus Paceibacterota bacterium]
MLYSNEQSIPEKELAVSAKRIFDVVISSFFLLLFSPLLACIACLVWLDSFGPIIFKQKRVGRHKMPFIIFKFKTMQDGGDKRVTKFGKVLRRTHLDELPQLWNVVRGEMSLVGPRPLILEHVAEIEAELSDYNARFVVLPGMTGFVQIAGRMETLRGGINEALLLDLAYIKDHNFFLDIIIIAKTVLAVFKLQGI